MGRTRVETNWAELFIAVLSSRKFTKFFDGVEFVLPDGKKTKIKIESYHKGTRADGFRISKFSFITKAVADNGVEGHGYGEGETELLTFQKSIAEAVERVIYKSIKPYYRLNSSNGWAAHLTAKKAKQSALNELLERDATLAHWLTKTPFNEIDPATFPNWLKNWCATELSKAPEFNRLRLLMTTVGHLPVIQSVIMNKDGFAFISQGASKKIDTAIYRALAETCRIADGANDEFQGSDLDQATAHVIPWDHALAYTKKQFPAWVFGKMISYDDAKNAIERNAFSLRDLAPEFKTYSCGDIYIAQCESKKVQKLFFGRGDFAFQKGLINVDRLREVNSNFVLNELPHCVP